MRNKLQTALEHGNPRQAATLFVAYYKTVYQQCATTRVAFALDFMVSQLSFAELARLLHAYGLWPLFLDLFLFATRDVERILRNRFSGVQRRIVLILSTVPEAVAMLSSRDTLLKAAPWIYMCLQSWPNPVELARALEPHIVVLGSWIVPHLQTGYFAAKILIEFVRCGTPHRERAQNALVEALCSEDIWIDTVNAIVRSGIVASIKAFPAGAIRTLNSAEDAVWDDMRPWTPRARTGTAGTLVV